MMYKFLWNVRLWLTGWYALIIMPFVVLWALLVEGPIEFGKKFESEKE